MVCGRWRAERELECETGMHARIIQSHMEMQITDSYRAVGLLRLTNVPCRASSVSNTFTVPPSGTVTMRIAHASGYGWLAFVHTHT